MKGVPYETEKVQPSVGRFGALKALADGIVLVELALLDCNVDSDDILPHDASRSNIQMTVRLHCQQNLGGDGQSGGEADPTSELPMRPSERPTAVPWAASVRYACSFAMVSMFVVVPASMALPFMPSLGATPQPSCTLSRYKITSGSVGNLCE